MPNRYPNMKETDSADPALRTEYNVRDSDGTVVFSRGEPFGGTKWTVEVCRRLRKPLLCLDLSTRSTQAAALRMLEWTAAEGIEVLNVAGPRASEDADIHAAVCSVLDIALPARPDDTRHAGGAPPPRTVLAQRTTGMISSKAPEKKTIEVRGRRMAYVEMGEGDPVVFQHGNPTSSYLWRNIMPHVAPVGRCIAIDLIGMGDSQKLDDPGPGRYRFVEHRAFLDAALAALGVESNVTWVVHDWGSALGFDWANRKRGATKGIAYMEAIVRPLMWEEWPEKARRVFQGFRSEAGEQMVLENNVFVERVLPGSILRGLTEEEMTVYRAPFTEPGESRRPTLTWPREIPIEGTPADVTEIVRSYSEWMTGNDIPKLFVNADPGAILTGVQREFCRGWSRQEEVTVAGAHFIQEDSPHEIGRAVADFVRRIDS